MSNLGLPTGNGTLSLMRVNLKEMRKERGWTIDHLADLSGLSKGYLSQLENDKRQPSMETLRDLAGIFDVSVSALVADQADAQADETDQMIAAEVRQLGPKEKAAILAAARALRGKAPPAES